MFGLKEQRPLPPHSNFEINLTCGTVAALVAAFLFHEQIGDLLSHFSQHGDASGTGDLSGTDLGHYLSSNGVDISWLWHSYSTEGTNAFRFHHDPLADPPQGNELNGLVDIHIAHFDPNHPHVFGDPTMSPQAFLKWAEHAGVHGEPAPFYTDGTAMQLYYVLWLNGVDPRAWAAIVMAEDHGGTDANWYAAGTGDLINELYNSHIANDHAPGFYDHVVHGYHYMDFDRFGNAKETVAAEYAAALFAHWYNQNEAYNNPITLEHMLSGGDMNAASNTAYWLSHLPS